MSFYEESSLKLPPVLDAKTQQSKLEELVSLRSEAITVFLSRPRIAYEQAQLIHSHRNGSALPIEQRRWYHKFDEQKEGREKPLQKVKHLYTNFGIGFNEKKDGFFADDRFAHCLTSFYPTIKLVNDTFPNHRNDEGSESWSKVLGKLLNDYAQVHATLLYHNQRLSSYIASKYVSRANHLSFSDFSDLIQEGNVGLSHALDLFDGRNKLTTYANWWIKQRITRAIADTGKHIRTPVHVSSKITKLFAVKHQMTLDNEVEPTEEELAAELNMSVAKIKELYRAAGIVQTVSLDSTIDHESNNTYHEVISDQSKSDFENNQESDESAKLRKYISNCGLTKRELDILKKRMPLPPYTQKRTLEEIGEEYQVTRERIRQIEAKAIEKLRHPTRMREIKKIFPGFGTNAA